MEEVRRNPVLEAVLWLLLLAALSPVFVDWGRHLSSEPVARYVVLFVPLTLLLAWRMRGRGVQRSIALWWVAGALLLSVLAVGAGLTRFARPCLPLALVGMACWRGWPRLEVALSSLWWVPVPSFVAKAMGRVVASLIPGGVPPEPTELGLPLAGLLSGLAYAIAIWRGQSLARALRLALVAGSVGLLLQGLGLALGLP